MKRIAVLLVISLVVVACGDDDTGGDATVVIEDSSSSSTSAAAAETTTTTAAPATTAAPTVDGPADCREIWPEEFVASVIGSADAVTGNDDNSACVYSLNPGVVLAWRADTMAGFETSRSGAELSGGTTDVAVCDAGWWVELQGAGIIMEAYDAAKGRAYNATITGAPMDIDTWVAWGTELLGSAC